MTALIRATLLAVVLGIGAPEAHAASAAELYQASYDLEAVQDYTGALSKMDDLASQGKDYVFHLRRGWLLYLLGRYGDSAEAYRAAVAAAPKSLEARQGLALPLMALKRWKEAETACKELLAIAPTDYRGNSRLAYIYYSTGDYAGAAARYQKVLEWYPSDVEMQAGLGWAQLKQGKVGDAKQTFEAVLRVAPSHVSAREGLDAAG
jgi:tetratricopeptide (TPR) repeat protein